MAQLTTKEQVLDMILKAGDFSMRDRDEKERSLSVYYSPKGGWKERGKIVYKTVGQLVNSECKRLGIKDVYPDDIVNPGFIPTPSYAEIHRGKYYRGIVLAPVKLRVERNSVTMAYVRYDDDECDEEIFGWRYYNVVRKVDIYVPDEIKDLFRVCPSVECLDIEWDEHTLNIKVWIVANGRRSSCFEVVSDWKLKFSDIADAYIAEKILGIVWGGLPKKQLLQSVEIDYEAVQQKCAQVRQRRAEEQKRRAEEQERRAEEARKRLKKNRIRNQRIEQIIFVTVFLAFIIVADNCFNQSKKRNQENKYQTTKTVIKKSLTNFNTISY